MEDHSSHSSNTVNHQQKKIKPTQGKPEWQRSAIRICGYWSEQLSSKGRIYFYNCMTEVSQWQKPSEWSLPDMSRKELLKLLNERKASEDKKLKRTHSCMNSDSVTTKDDIGVTADSFKRLKYCSTTDSRKSSTTQMGNNFPINSNEPSDSNQSVHCNTVNCSGLRRFESYEDGFKPVHQGSHRSHCNSSLNINSKKEQINNLPFRSVLTDDMEISPNSSPLSDESSPLSAVNKGRSPSKLKYDHTSPSVNVQRSQYQKLKSGSASDWDSTKSGKSSSALCQLVDAIRASIGELLDQSPGSSFRHPDGTSPTSNGTTRLPRKLLRESTSNSNPLLTSPQSAHPSDAPVTKCSSMGFNTSAVPTGSLTDLISISKQNAHSKNDSPLIVLGTHRVDQRAANLPSHSLSQCAAQTSPSVIFSPQTPNQIPMCSRSVGGVQSTSCSSGLGITTNQVNGIPSGYQTTAPDFKHNRTVESRSAYRDYSPGDSYSKVHHGSTSGDARSGLLSPHSTSRSHNSRCGQFDHDDPLQRFIPDPQVHTRSQHSQLNDLVQVLKTALQQNQTVQSVSNSSNPQNARIMSSRASILSPQLSMERDSSSRHLTTSPDCRTQHNRFHGNSGAQSRTGYDLWSCKDSVTDEVHSKPSPTASGNQAVSSTLPSANASISDPLVSAADVASKSGIPSPNSSFPTSRLTHGNPHSVPVTTSDSNEPVKPDPSPKSELDCNLTALESPDIQKFLDPSLISRYQDEVLNRLEQEAQMEWRKFDRLQSVLYAELSAESKKLRALVRISVAKLTIHKEKQTALQELMDVIETRKQLPNLSFSDNIL